MDKNNVGSAPAAQPLAGRPVLNRKPEFAPAVMWALTELFGMDESWAERLTYGGVANADGYMLMREARRYEDGADVYEYLVWSDAHKLAYASVGALLDDFFGYWGGPEPVGTRETLGGFAAHAGHWFSAVEVTSGSVENIHIPPGQFRDIELTVRLYG